MKRLSLVALLFPVLAFAGASNVDVTLDYDKNYIDLDLNLVKSKSYSEFERILEKYLSKTVVSELGQGYQLDIEFTEVDMAGNMDAFASPSPVRSVNVNSDTLRLEFNYKLKDPSGAEVASGSKVLKDIGVTLGARDSRFKNNKEMYFEIRALNTWIVEEFTQ